MRQGQTTIARGAQPWDLLCARPAQPGRAAGGAHVGHAGLHACFSGCLGECLRAPGVLSHGKYCAHALHPAPVVPQVVLMSATLDSTLFSGYFGDCPVLSAGGRTFPVQHHFLEDAYEATRYALDPDGFCAIRPGAANAKAALRAVSQRDRGSVQVPGPSTTSVLCGQGIGSGRCYVSRVKKESSQPRTGCADCRTRRQPLCAPTATQFHATSAQAGHSAGADHAGGGWRLGG